MKGWGDGRPLGPLCEGRRKQRHGGLQLSPHLDRSSEAPPHTRRQGQKSCLRTRAGQSVRARRVEEALKKRQGPGPPTGPQWEDSALPCDCRPGRWGLARAQAHRRRFHLLRLPVVPCSSGSKLNLPPRCEELLRKAIESHSQREKAFRQKCRGKKIRGRGVAAEVGSGLAASDVSEDGVFSRTVGAFRAMGVSGK